jgi:streptogramin lyase
MTLPRLIGCTLAAALLCAASTAVSTRSVVGAPAPRLDTPLAATFVAGPLTLAGSGFGAAPSPRSLVFDFEGRSLTLDATSSLVTLWRDDRIDLTLPPDVHSGTVRVVVNGASSTSARLLVYVYTSVATQVVSGARESPNVLALAADRRLWVLDEAGDALKSLTDDDPPAESVYTVPAAQGGIFAYTNSAGIDSRTRLTTNAEGMAVASDGSVWFTQGGGALYGGIYKNTSRIVRFEPASGRFTCYVVPADDAEVYGLALDEVRGLVWYAESDYVHGNAITSFDPATAPADCLFDPYSTAPRPAYCGAAPTAGCHRRYVMQTYLAPAQLVVDAAGDVWFSAFWANRIGRLHPADGTVTELPLPPRIALAGPGWLMGAGPWSLRADASGDLWLAEYFDATVDRIRPSRMATADCTRLDAAARNPCIEEIYVASNGTDGITVSAAVPGNEGRVWFTQSDPARIGFIDTTAGDEVVLLPPLPNSPEDASDILEDPVTGDVWFGEFSRHAVGRLQLATGDGDGVPDNADNCPGVYNPDQANHDAMIDLSPSGLRFNDVTNPYSDTLGDACDADVDNDHLPNSVEVSLPSAACPAASAATDPMRADTDVDGVIDGAECALGSDPADRNSVPASGPAGDTDGDGLGDDVETALGTDPRSADSDGDHITDGTEYLALGSDPLATDSDGDGCGDRRELASINNDRIVSSVDVLIVASVFGTRRGAARYTSNFDINRDGSVTAADMGAVAAAWGLCSSP